MSKKQPTMSFDNILRLSNFSEDFYSPSISENINQEHCESELKYNYYGHSCDFFKLKDGTFCLPPYSHLCSLRDNNFIRENQWLVNARARFSIEENSKVSSVGKYLIFDSLNRICTFIYGNAVNVNKAVCTEVKYDTLEVVKMSETENKVTVDITTVERQNALEQELKYLRERREKQERDEALKANITSAVTDAVQPLIDMQKQDNTTFIEPYKDLIELELRDTNTYNKDLGYIDNEMLNPDNVTEALSKLKYSGLYLAGEAGIGKGRLAQTIGAKLVSENNSYKGYVNLVIHCSDMLNPASVSFGTGMNNKEYLGAFYSLFKYANENLDVACVMILDELNRTSWEDILVPIFELLSEKGASKMQCLDGTVLTYTSNIYLIATGNVGASFKNAKVDDTGFQDRFEYMRLSNLFESLAFIKRYSETASNLDETTLSSDVIYTVLSELYEELDSDKYRQSSISLRRLNRIVRSSKTEDELRRGVISLFSLEVRKELFNED